MNHLTISTLRACLAALLMIAVTIGCKETDNTIVPAPIEGGWKLTAMKLNPALDAGPLGKVSDLLPMLSSTYKTTCFTDMTITFTSNGTMTTDNPASCKGDLAGEDMNDAIGFDVNNRYTVVGDKLTITDGYGERTEYKVAINSNTMQWVTETEFEDADGELVKHTVTTELKRAGK
ncbi:hypothetical protein GCM10023189_20250 [Nibrella saemangeumensis]|uniref:Lipocalin-like domain-containing protein n=1 Tax=Nibrella saemangeumensis TaxID=1084526 RepID=A0ABP8MRG1_9BACT